MFPGQRSRIANAPLMERSQPGASGESDNGQNNKRNLTHGGRSNLF